MNFKPNLAAKADLKLLRYPVLASPKLDGIRAAVVEGKLLSRTLKPIPNKWINWRLSQAMLEGFDGELIVGDAWSKTCYRDTVSVVMSDDKEPTDLRFYCFDLWNAPLPYVRRWHQLQHQASELSNIWPVDVLEQLIVNTEYELLEYEEAALEKGFEGLILRDPEARYKFGRSTLGKKVKGQPLPVGEQGIMKLKRFVDGEAEILGVVEEMFNGNVAQINELGRTKRSTEKAGLVGKGTMGALEVRDIVTGVEFRIGTGFDDADRAAEWKLGDVVRYKHFPIGVKERPRHPVFTGRRPEGA